MSGDANFSMDITSLTIGGFTQPTVARNLIELQASVEKGLSPRFLWIFPKPTYAQFETLEKVDESFTHSLGMYDMVTHNIQFHTMYMYISLVSLMSSLWNPNKTIIREFKIPNPFPCYQTRYNEIQTHLEKLSGLDELLSGL